MSHFYHIDAHFMSHFRYKVKINQMKAEDSQSCAEIYYQVRMDEFSWEKTDQINIDDFVNHTEGELVLVARYGEEIAGFISVWEPDAFIHCLFIDKRYRRKGIALALLQEVQRRFPQQALQLKCVVENETARRFYESDGFRILEKVEDEVPYYLMELSASI